MLYINSTKTLCRLQKLILTVPILLFHMLFKEKNGFCFDQTGGTKKLDFDLFKCYKRLEHEKQMKNGLIVWFRLRVMVHKMSKMIHFLNVYAEINKKYTHFRDCQDRDLEGVVVQKKWPKGNGSTVTRAQYHV